MTDTDIEHGSAAVDLAASFQRLRQASRHDLVPDAEWRRSRLLRLGNAIREHEETLVAAVSRDFGHRSAHETRLLELFPCLEAARHARRHLRRWMRPQRRPVSPWLWPARARLVCQPLGVVGIVVPWNYPVYLALAPLVGALAAGNRAMLKLSEYTPATAEALIRLLADAFNSDEVVAVGGDVSVARAFSTLPWDHLLFTGSTSVGREVMRAAAANLTPVTLELGGKSPAIFAPDARWEAAVERCLMGKLFNAGQTCVAPDYVLLPAGYEARFIEIARQVVARRYPQMPAGADYSSIINDAQFQRLQALLAEAREQGARLSMFGAVDSGARRLPLTLVQGLPEDCALLREEIFGPVLPLITYTSLDQAIDYVNARPRPLALYYFGEARTGARRVIRETVSGGVAVNDALLQVAVEDLPFGGVGPSGMGEYHGRDGFETFSKQKSVLYQSRFSVSRWLYPPYGWWADRLLTLMLRR